MKKTLYAAAIAGTAAAAAVAAIYLYRETAAQPEMEIAASPDPAVVEDEDTARLPEGPHFDYPSVEATILRSEIVADMGGFDSPMRKVTVLGDDGQEMEVTSAFHRHLSKDQLEDDGRKITVFADLNAAFTEIFKVKVGTTDHGATIQLHVGEFAQDYCGPLTAVYTVTSDEVSSLIDLEDGGYGLYGRSGCTIGAPAGGETCESRAHCVRSHLQGMSFDALLDASRLKQLKTLRIH